MHDAPFCWRQHIIMRRSAAAFPGRTMRLTGCGYSEEFVAGEAKAGRFAAKFNPVDAPILLHGHCHQKAFGAVDRCRHQIHDGAQREALHEARLLERQLAVTPA